MIKESTNDIDKALALLRVVTDLPDEIKVFKIYGNPPSKARARFRKDGGVYKTSKSRAAETKTAQEFRNVFKDPLLGNVALVCIFYRSSKQRIDTDNMLKHVCDSANKIAWLDDSQVTAITGIMELDVENPRTVIGIAPHSSTMTKGVDSKRKCKLCDTFILLKGLWDKKIYCNDCRYKDVSRNKIIREPKKCLMCDNIFSPRVNQTLCSHACRGKLLSSRKKAKFRNFSRCSVCDAELAHRRGGKCRPCWLKSFKRQSKVAR